MSADTTERGRSPHDKAGQLAYWLLKDVGRAVRDYAMIRDGERIAVALSGGKDSLSLLTLLDRRRRIVPERYELVAIHVLGDGRGPAEAHPALVGWLEAGGYEYHLEPLSLPEGETLPMDCQRCTWNRRRVLFEAAARLGCQAVAFGHHADDLAQTTLLNVLFSARAETMPPASDYFGGALRLIRPLCYLWEKDVERYARLSGFPPPPPACPRGDISTRQLAAGLIRQAETGCRNARANLLSTGLRYLK